jgi:hypothetical protein
MIERIKALASAEIKAYRKWEYVDRVWGEVTCADGSAGINDFTINTEEDRPQYLIPELLCYSDYSDSSTIHVANRRAFLQEYEDYCIELYGDFNYHGIALSIDWLCAEENKETASEMLETLEALENYPVIDEEVLSEVEMELSNEAWESWVEHDYVRGLEEHHEITLDINDENKGPFGVMFNEVLNREEIYWYPENVDMTIKISDVVEATTLRDLIPFIDDWGENEVLEPHDPNQMELFNESS